MNWELIIPIAFGAVFVVTWCWAMYRGAESPSATQLPPKSTCMICVEEDDDVVSAYYPGRFGSRTYNYHMACVVDAVCNPDKYDGYRVEYALQIVDGIAAARHAAKDQELNNIKAALIRKSKCRKACKKLRDEDLIPS